MHYALYHVTCSTRIVHRQAAPHQCAPTLGTFLAFWDHREIMGALHSKQLCSKRALFFATEHGMRSRLCLRSQPRSLWNDHNERCPVFACDMAMRARGIALQHLAQDILALLVRGRCDEGKPTTAVATGTRHLGRVGHVIYEFAQPTPHITWVAEDFRFIFHARDGHFLFCELEIAHKAEVFCQRIGRSALRSCGTSENDDSARCVLADCFQ